MVKRFCVPKILSDEEVKLLEGEFMNESDLHVIVKEDADVYALQDDGSQKLLFKFRRNVICDELCQIGFENFKKLAILSRGRGAAGGPIDELTDYWSKRKLVKTKKWRTKYMNGDKESKMVVGNPVMSHALGYYEASPNFKLPCRLTYTTGKNIDKFTNGLPYIEKINELYQDLVPECHKKQLERAREKSDFQIKDTAFSTITVNRNFRTAIHQDAGDYSEGFGNLSVLEYGGYSGGYTGFPQYGVGVDLREGDFMCMDVHQYHANTPLYETDLDKAYNETLPPVFKNVGQVGNHEVNKKYARMSFVCYLREKIIKCE